MPDSVPISIPKNTGIPTAWRLAAPAPDPQIARFSIA